MKGRQLTHSWENFLLLIDDTASSIVAAHDATGLK